jgi:hypothetical protein
VKGDLLSRETLKGIIFSTVQETIQYGSFSVATAALAKLER